jgi:hypothetical protein
MSSLLTGTSETMAREDVLPSTADANRDPSKAKRPRGLAFNANPDEITESGQVVPHTLREMRASRPPKDELGGATERPIRHATDPNIMDESFHPPPVTLPGGPEADGASTSRSGEHSMPEELPSGDLLVDEPTGQGTKLDLESTHARPHDEDEIVIADDLAEIVEDGHRTHDDAEEENTDAGATIPPYTSKN